MWKDQWTWEILANSHPRAFSFARDEEISVRAFLGITSLAEALHLPLSMQAHDEVRHLLEITADVGTTSALEATDL